LVDDKLAVKAVVEMLLQIPLHSGAQLTVEVTIELVDDAFAVQFTAFVAK
jgi:hypothetical protein